MDLLSATHHCLKDALSTLFFSTPLLSLPSTSGCPDNGPQVETSPEILPGSATITWQAVQTDDPFLTTGMRYAVYSRCGSEGSFQLVAENIEGVSYTVTGLPAPAQCVLRVVAYHRYCLRDVDGAFTSNTLTFTTAIVGKDFLQIKADLFQKAHLERSISQDTLLILLPIQLLKGHLLPMSLWVMVGSPLMTLDLKKL